MGGKCEGQFLLIFILERIHFIQKNIKVSEKLNSRKILAYLLCITRTLNLVIEEIIENIYINIEFFSCDENINDVAL